MSARRRAGGARPPEFLRATLQGSPRWLRWILSTPYRRLGFGAGWIGLAALMPALAVLTPDRYWDARGAPLGLVVAPLIAGIGVVYVVASVQDLRRGENRAVVAERVTAAMATPIGLVAVGVLLAVSAVVVLSLV